MQGGQHQILLLLSLPDAVASYHPQSAAQSELLPGFVSGSKCHFIVMECDVQYECVRRCYSAFQTRKRHKKGECHVTW